MRAPRALEPLLILALVCAAYFNTLDVPFVLDDVQKITENHFLRDPGYYWPPWGTRWLGYLSLSANLWLGGSLAGFHLFNIAVHGASALLVYALVRRLGLGSAFGAAFMAGALFALHPLQIQAVTYTVQRLASLCTMLYLGAAVLYVISAQGRSRIAYAGALLCALLAFKTKEISVTLPVTLLMIDLYMQGEGAALRTRALRLAPFFALALIVPLEVVMGYGPADTGEAGLAAASALKTETGRVEYLATELRVILTYLRLVLLPINQNLDPDPPLYTSLLQGPVLASGAVLAALFAAGAWMLFSRRAPLAGLGVLWMFVTLSVESGLVPIQDVMFEHRMYLPMCGVAMTAGAALQWMRTRPLGTAGAAVLMAALLSLTIARNQLWRDDLALWQDAALKSPAKARPFNSAGSLLYKRGRADEALSYLNRAVALKPDYADAYYNRGTVLMSADRVEQALRDFTWAVALEPGHAAAHGNLGAALNRVGRPADAVREYTNALQLGGPRHLLYFNRGNAYFAMGDRARAAADFRASLAADPTFTPALQNLGTMSPDN